MAKVWFGYVLEPGGYVSSMVYDIDEKGCKAKIMAALLDDQMNSLGMSEAGYVGRVECGAPMEFPFHESPNMKNVSRFTVKSKQWEAADGVR